MTCDATPAPPLPLAIFQGALGDTVAAMPALVELSRRYGGLEVRGIAGRLRLLDLAGERFVHGSIESIGWHRLFLPGGAPEVSVARRVVHVPADEPVVSNLERLGAVVRPYRPLPGAGEAIHFSDHYWRELAGGTGRAPDPRLTAPDSPAGGAYWVLHPGSGSARKNRPAVDLAELVRRSPVPPVLVAGEADDRALERLLTELGRELEVRREPPLLDLVALLAGARAVVGHDSGPSHLAAALGVPTYALFSSSDPSYWGPRGPRATAVGPDRPAASLAVAIAGHLGENAPDAGRPPRPYSL